MVSSWSQEASMLLRLEWCQRKICKTKWKDLSERKCSSSSSSSSSSSKILVWFTGSGRRWSWEMWCLLCPVPGMAVQIQAPSLLSMEIIPETFLTETITASLHHPRINVRQAFDLLASFSLFISTIFSLGMKLCVRVNTFPSLTYNNTPVTDYSYSTSTNNTPRRNRCNTKNFFFF